GRDLGPDYHNAHLAAWSRGGATTVGNVQAWCADCNLGLGGRDSELAEGVTLRQWQAQALPVILRQLYQSGVATLHAAPGAGKTLFAGVIFQRLFELQYVNRLVVVVPNLVIVEQWRETLGRLRIHLDTQPRDGVIEHPETVGAVITYHGLPRSAGAHATRNERVPTLVVLDEVHHVAGEASWGRAVERIVGDVANGTVHARGVLNMTGTLFRSSRAKRISTVRYQRVVTDDGEKLEAVADWSVGTAALVGSELRPPDLYAYTSHAQLVDLHGETVISGEIADLDRQQRAAVIRNSFTQRVWLKGFVSEAVRMLNNQLRAIQEREPLKLLFVAQNQWAAKVAADTINEVTGQDFARLVVSDEPQAVKTLRKAVLEPHPCAIVAVQMVTEGFDCPQVATIAYAANITADLFVAQMMARAMRITQTERADRRVLPAQILIPDHPELRRAFASALADARHLVQDKEQAQAGQGGSGGDGVVRLPRYELLDLTDPRLNSATVLGEQDGEIPAAELAPFFPDCQALGIPEVYVPRVAVVARRRRPPLRIYADGPTPPKPRPTVTPLDPRSRNLAYRAQIHEAAKWMVYHVDHDAHFDSVERFQGQANQAASIPRGGRDQATGEQLRTCADWMAARVAEHCQQHEEPLPAWAEDEEDREEPQP
ncbi:MAG TPA: DEAD/DEAH box helicase family protein, partial [Actinomycetes bacterium]|nr:DEAD/DEAH box helicase family protein [Actinomycetes bacterium]